MLVSDPVLVAAREISLAHTSFRSWQRDATLNGVLPIIGIGGTRGKSTVLRLVESMLITMHLRRATWTGLQLVAAQSLRDRESSLCLDRRVQTQRKEWRWCSQHTLLTQPATILSNRQ